MNCINNQNKICTCNKITCNNLKEYWQNWDEEKD